MFIPFMIHTDYDRRPWFTWIFAGIVVFLNLLFFGLEAVGFDWLIEAKYSEVLRVMDFNADALLFYNYISYALFFPNIWVFLIDIFALLYFGMAVEARLGGWRTALLFFVCIATGAAAQQFLATQYRFAGMTAGCFGLLGAAILLFSWSETDGLALVPVPPDWDIGLTKVYTVFFLVIWAAIPLTYTFLTRHDRLSIIGPIGMGVGLAFGLILGAGLMNFEIPLFWPKKYDPTVQNRMAAQERRQRLTNDLEQDGIGSQRQESLLEGEVEESPTTGLGLPENPDFGSPFSGAGQDDFDDEDEEEAPRAQSIENRKNSLAKLALMRASPELAEAYESFFKDYPDECLKSGDQLEVARQLENSFFRELALNAYERLVRAHPDTPAAGQALLRGGKICVHLDGKEKQGLAMLDHYLETEPGRAQVLEAREAMDQLKKRLEEKGEDGDAGEEVWESGPQPREDSAPDPSGASSFQQPDRAGEMDLGALPAYESSSATGEWPLKIDGLESREVPDLKETDLTLPSGEGFQKEMTEKSEPIEFPDEPEKLEKPEVSDGDFILPRVRKSSDEEIVIQPREDGEMEIKIEISERKASAKSEGPPTPDPDSDESMETPGDPMFLKASARGLEDASRLIDIDADADVFSVILEPDHPPRIKRLALSLSETLSESQDVVRDRLMRRKGLIEQDLNLEEARMVLAACADAGCPARIVAQTPQLKFGEPRDAEMVRLDSGTLIWTLSIGEKKAEARKALMLSAGAVRLDDEGERVRMVFSAYFADPPEAFHLWESTLRSELDSSLDGVFPEEALRLLSERVADACPRARKTHGFNLAFGDNDEEALLFHNQMEFRSYDIWNLMAAYAPSPETE